ncbi:hypothetical protein SBA2_150015 [Acidobacteriia bacterium SbA2]|nr:hypothetical protein SBA2_150015 [Acidobacteriia bacterium SbA2]
MAPTFRACPERSEGSADAPTGRGATPKLGHYGLAGKGEFSDEGSNRRFIDSRNCSKSGKWISATAEVDGFGAAR